MGKYFPYPNTARLRKYYTDSSHMEPSNTTYYINVRKKKRKKKDTEKLSGFG